MIGLYTRLLFDCSGSSQLIRLKVIWKVTFGISFSSLGA